MKKRLFTNKWSHQSVGHSSFDNRQERARLLDGYNTPSIAVKELLKREQFCSKVWEPAAGNLRITKVLKKQGHQVYSSDIYRWNKKINKKIDFLKTTKLPFKFGDIITNPPFIIAQSFVEHAMALLKPKGQLALLLRLQFLEGQKRKIMFEKFPPKHIWVFSKRIPRMHRFGFKNKTSTSVIAFAWFVWQKGYEGPSVVRWI